MKLSIETKLLAAALDQARGAVEGRTTIPILSHFRMVADQEGLRIAATNLDQKIEVALPAKDGAGATLTVSRAGACCVPADILRGMVRSITAAETTLAVDDDQRSIKVSAGRARASIPILPVDDFPTIGDDDSKLPHRFTLPGKTLAQLIALTIIGVSHEVTRYYLNGVFLHVVQDLLDTPALVAVATDGHRLIRAALPAPATLIDAGGAVLSGITIPNAALDMLQRLGAAAGDEAVEIAHGAALFRAESNGTNIVTKLVDGTYPEYARILPASNGGTRVVFEGPDLLSALKRVAIAFEAKSKGVRFTAREGGEIHLLSSSAGTATIEDVVAGDVTLAGGAGDDRAVIGLNGHYMRDLVSIFGDRPVAMHMTDAGSPILLTSVDGMPIDGIHLTAICMPMNA